MEGGMFRCSPTSSALKGRSAEEKCRVNLHIVCMIFKFPPKKKKKEKKSIVQLRGITTFYVCTIFQKKFG